MRNNYDKETLLLCVAELHHSGIISGDEASKFTVEILKSSYKDSFEEVTS